jgi:hypothetical protein
MTSKAKLANNPAEEKSATAPPSIRDEQGRVDLDSVPDVIEWFLKYDPRVAVIRHSQVEEVFQWKQAQSKQAGEDVFIFSQAEDRLAIGIIQALAEHPYEQALYSWISQLLNALDAAARANEALAGLHRLDLRQAPSTLAEAEKIPLDEDRRDFLINCWIEALCTAEARVLGWLYQELYERPFLRRSDKGSV